MFLLYGVEEDNYMLFKPKWLWNYCMKGSITLRLLNGKVSWSNFQGEHYFFWPKSELDNALFASNNNWQTDEYTIYK